MQTILRFKGILLCLPPVLAYCAIGLLQPRMVPHILTLLPFLLAFLVLPAHALGGLLLPKGLSSSERAILGYPAAQAALFLLAFAGGRLGALWLPWALPALGLVALFVPGLRKKSAPLDTRTLWALMALTSAALACCVFALTEKPFPTPGFPADFYHDDVGSAAYMWAAVRALETGLPIAHPWVAGFPVSYHLIYHYSYAYAFLTTGVPLLEQVAFLWTPLHWAMLAGSVVIGGQRLAGLSLGASALAAVLMFFTAGLDFYATPAVQLFRFFQSFYYGHPALVVVLAGLYGHLTGRRPLPLLLISLAFLVVGGTKVNLLFLLPVCLLPVLLYRLATRRARREDFLLGLLWSAAAVVLKLTMFQDSERVIVKSLKLGSLFMGALANLGSMAMTVGPFVLLAVCAAESDPILRAKLHRDRQYHIFVLAFALVSAVLLKAINFIGGDFYFYWQLRVLTFVGFAGLGAHLLRWRTRLFAPALAVLLALGCGLFVNSHFFAVAGSWQPVDPQAKNIDIHELEGLRWASANLDRSRSMFSNKEQYLGNYMGTNIRIDALDYLGLSGLQGWSWPGEWLGPSLKAAAAPRDALKERFLTAQSPGDREAALAQIGADYYFHCERQVKSDFAGLSGLREVYRNPSLTIFELTRARPGQ